MTTSMSAELPARRRPRSLAQELVESLSTRLRTGEIRPGDKLPTESEIMRAFGVSRTVVREALSRLQASGLVETHHGVGTYALKPTVG
ncbi:MAG TPA: GntR family transcriptional regulator, partial [Bordetella sp.]|nr:GntR family transcriptional regulator [Bordetella sp.]